MKKILTILTVALLACTTVFAALNVSGEFEAGYKFSFKDGFTAEPQDDQEGKVTLKISDDAGIWTVNMKALSSLDSSNALKANLSLNVAALLAANGVDMGDLSLALSLGANDKLTALSAYNDVTGDAGFKFKNFSDGYGKGGYATEVSVGYGDMIQAKFGIDPVHEPTSEMPIVASVMSAPVDGVKVSVAYSHNAAIYALGSDGNEVDVANAFGGAVDLNIGALLDSDFALGVTVYDNFGWGGFTSSADSQKNGVAVAGDTYNAFAAAVYGGVDVVDAFFELRMDNATIAKKTTTTLGMKTQVNLNVVENLGLDVYLAASDFSDFGNTFAVGGDASYTISGVKFAANLEYGATAGFSVTPKVVITF